MNAAATTTPTPAAPNLLRQQSSALKRHLSDCRAARGRWFEAALWAELAHAALAPRFVTTVAVLAAAVTLACGWA